jgi:hypothetical protein
MKVEGGLSDADASPLAGVAATQAPQRDSTRAGMASSFMSLVRKGFDGWIVLGCDAEKAKRCRTAIFADKRCEIGLDTFRNTSYGNRHAGPIPFGLGWNVDSLSINEKHCQKHARVFHRNRPNVSGLRAAGRRMPWVAGKNAAL